MYNKDPIFEIILCCCGCARLKIKTTLFSLIVSRLNYTIRDKILPTCCKLKFFNFLTYFLLEITH
jgi:hypothetical protein